MNLQVTVHLWHIRGLWLLFEACFQSQSDESEPEPHSTQPNPLSLRSEVERIRQPENPNAHSV